MKATCLGCLLAWGDGGRRFPSVGRRCGSLRAPDELGSSSGAAAGASRSKPGLNPQNNPHPTNFDSTYWNGPRGPDRLQQISNLVVSRTTATIQIAGTTRNLDVPGFRVMRNYPLSIPNWPKPSRPPLTASFFTLPVIYRSLMTYSISPMRVSLKTG